MAKYGEYTEKQQDMINLLSEQAKKIKRNIDIQETKLRKNPLMNFEPNKITREKLRDLKAEYKEVTTELNDILNAYEEYQDCLRVAIINTKRAETLRDTWGFSDEMGKLYRETFSV